MNLDKIAIKNIVLTDEKETLPTVSMIDKIYGRGFLMYAYVETNTKTTFTTENKIINISETSVSKGYAFSIAPIIGQNCGFYYASYSDILVPTIEASPIKEYFKKVNLKSSTNLYTSPSASSFYYGADVLTFKEYLQIDIEFYKTGKRNCAFVIVYEPAE